MKNIIKIWMLTAAVGAFTACNTDEEAQEIQKPYTYDEQYFANIREYKASEHSISYVYYAGWAPLEGVDGYKDPASWGERLKGLPDSVDIVNLWMSIPSNDPSDSNYAPVAYEDMIYCQTTLGTRFVSHVDACNNQVFKFNGKYYDVLEGSGDGSSEESPIGGEEAIKAYGEYHIDQMYKYNLNGIDIDWEPGQRPTWLGDNLYILVSHMNQFIGPNSKDPSKLLIVDYYPGMGVPSSSIEPHIDYLLTQYYTSQDSASATGLDNRYNGVNWCPPEKFIICEDFGHGQGPAGGQSDFNYYGTAMTSIYAYARWNPSTGRKGGFGAYSFENNYASTTGIPYYEFRHAIQIQNPAIY